MIGAEIDEEMCRKNSTEKRSQDEENRGVDLQRGARQKVKLEQPPPKPSRPSLSTSEPKEAWRNVDSPSEPLQDSRGYKSQLDTAALEKEAEEVREFLELGAAANPNRDVKSFFEDEVKVKRDEKEAVAKAVHPFRDRIKTFLNESIKWKWDFFNTGSTYDGTKVCIADYCLHYHHHHHYSHYHHLK